MSSFILVVIIFCLRMFSNFSFYVLQIILTFYILLLEIINVFCFHFGISMYYITYIVLYLYKNSEK